MFTAGETVDFEFETIGLMLSGIIDIPTQKPVEALIIIVHSYGETDVRNWISYAPERQRFNELGIATVLWDKPGLGGSEGTFDIDQSVHESAQEVVDAAAYLRKIGAPGAHKIGLWGGSRAGWIAPIALSQDTEIEFWISLSGTSAEDNFTYLLLSNLPFEGSSAEQVDQLETQWREGCRITRTGGSYSDYQQATRELRANEYIKRMRGEWPSRLQYTLQQTQCRDGHCKSLDDDLCDYVWIDNFDQMLSSLEIDVLALFGEKDLNINWRKTRSLYSRTIGSNTEATLKTVVFDNADHALNNTRTGSLKEMSAATASTKADGYFEIQLNWLQDVVLDSD
ncbi:MAG: CocE/NonD family hydrolase [Pseudomonadota bacterium]